MGGTDLGAVADWREAIDGSSVVVWFPAELDSGHELREALATGRPLVVPHSPIVRDHLRACGAPAYTFAGLHDTIGMAGAVHAALAGGRGRRLGEHARSAVLAESWERSANRVVEALAPRAVRAVPRPRARGDRLAIALIDIHGSDGGGERLLTEIVEGLCRHPSRPDVRLVCVDDPDVNFSPPLRRARAAGATVTRRPPRGGRGGRAIRARRRRRRLADLGPDRRAGRVGDAGGGDDPRRRVAALRDHRRQRRGDRGAHRARLGRDRRSRHVLVPLHPRRHRRPDPRCRRAPQRHPARRAARGRDSERRAGRGRPPALRAACEVPAQPRAPQPAQELRRARARRSRGCAARGGRSRSWRRAPAPTTRTGGRTSSGSGTCPPPTSRRSARARAASCRRRSTRPAASRSSRPCSRDFRSPARASRRSSSRSSATAVHAELFDPGDPEQLERALTTIWQPSPGDVQAFYENIRLVGRRTWRDVADDYLQVLAHAAGTGPARGPSVTLGAAPQGK